MSIPSYDDFLDIALKLSPPDLLALCSRNKQYSSYCKKPSLYEDLISIGFNIQMPKATYDDYKAIYQLENTKLILPDPDVTDSYDEVVQKAQTLLDDFTLKELEAQLDHRPLRYFTYPADRLDDECLLNQDRSLDGLWFESRTPQGAVLKFKDYHQCKDKQGHSYGDYISYIVNKLPRYQYEYPLVAKTIKKGDDRKKIYKSFHAPILIETDRPRVDDDLDGSKVTQAQSKLMSFIKKEAPIRTEEEEKIVIDLIKAYQKTEVNALKRGGKRYFIIKPRLLYEEMDKGNIFQDLSGTVIASASPEGAILRLTDLAPEFKKTFIDDIVSNKNRSAEVFVLTSDNLYSGKLIVSYYLVEINQPHIV